MTVILGDHLTTSFQADHLMATALVRCFACSKDILAHLRSQGPKAKLRMMNENRGI
jgi:hypothetical protein